MSKTVVLVDRDEWEGLLADVRGLKRLAGLEEAERQACDRRLGCAIDELERRIAATDDAVREVADMATRAGAEAVTLRRELASEQAARIMGDQSLTPARVPTIPTLADVAAAAPAPDLGEMREFYATARAEKEANEAAAGRPPEPVAEVHVANGSIADSAQSFPVADESKPAGLM